MYGGRIMEAGETPALFKTPTHPYTAGLLKAIPRLDQDHDILPTIDGEPPNMLGLPSGCPFHPRCERAIDRCATFEPILEQHGDRAFACHAPLREVA